MVTSVLFTKSKTLGSWLIRKITGEPVSHCAIRVDNLVIEASGVGIIVLPYDKFCKEDTVVFEVPVSGFKDDLTNMLSKYIGHNYDYMRLLYLGWVYLTKSKEDANIGHISGSYLCTEFVTTELYGQLDTEITPYQLYLKLTQGNK